MWHQGPTRGSHPIKITTQPVTLCNFIWGGEALNISQIKLIFNVKSACLKPNLRKILNWYWFYYKCISALKLHPINITTQPATLCNFIWGGEALNISQIKLIFNVESACLKPNLRKILNWYWFYYKCISVLKLSESAINS